MHSSLLKHYIIDHRSIKVDIHLVIKTLQDPSQANDRADVTFLATSRKDFSHVTGPVL